MIQWNASLSTGHETVDSDHQRLIAALNEFEVALHAGATVAQLTKIIDFLNAYTREHFQREEAYMKRMECPTFELNSAAHKALIVKLDTWINCMQTAATPQLTLEIYRELNAWVRNHVIRVDCQLRNCRKPTPTVE